MGVMGLVVMSKRELGRLEIVARLTRGQIGIDHAAGLMGIIPILNNQNSYAQALNPMEDMRHGWASSLRQASQQWATISS